MKKNYVILACFILMGALSSFGMTITPGAGNELKDTAKARVNSWISIHLVYQGKSMGKDTLLYDSKVFMKGNPLLIQLPPPDFTGDLFSNLAGLSSGDSITFGVPVDSLFLKTFRAPQRPAFIDSNSLITIHVKLYEIMTSEGMKKKEEELLKKYLADQKIMIQPSESGIYYIEQVKGTGVKIDSGCMVRMNLKVSLIDGKQLFSSAERPEPIRFRYGKQFDTPGINEALGKMSGGTKATVIVPSKNAWGEGGKGALIPPFSTLIYEVDIVDVQSKDDYEKEQVRKKFVESLKRDSLRVAEAQNLKKYLADQKITAKPTTSGLYYIEKVKGTGTQPVAGDKVKVHYTGTLLNGKKFDSSVDRNQPFEFTLGKGQVIKGWDEGIALMKKGGKATLIVPFNIAYGERSMGSDIPAFATLVFEVELLDVTKEPAK
jgi:FKBP-type peptidyl-prolyl cis-trans isomerase